MIENPIFIVGTERSGSNLLRLLLNEMDGVCVPHPPHLMRDLSPVIGRYGNLAIEKNFRRLIADAITLVNLHFAPWPLKLEADLIFEECATRDLYSVYASIYDQYRSHEGKSRWACKSTFMIHHVDEVLRHHREPRFIHLVRDPRDVAVSARHSVFSHYHPYYVAKLWRREQRLAIEAAKNLPSAAWMTLRYEDLIRHPARELRGACEFLGETYRDDLLKFFEKPAAKELSHLSRSWENVARPVMSGNSEKFKSHLAETEIALIEKIAGEEMGRFDYPKQTRNPTPTSPAIHPFSKAGYFLAEEWMMFREESKALLRDQNARHRLKKKAFLWSLRFRS